MDSTSSSNSSSSNGGMLHRRKDFLEKDEAAKNHPNRTYYYRKQDVDELMNRCDEELERDPSNVKARYIRASSFMKKKKYAKAMKDFEQVLRYKPDDIGSLYNRGVGTFFYFFYRRSSFAFRRPQRNTALEKLGRTKESIESYTKVLKLDPSHVNAAYARAACYNRVGDFAKAIEDYDFALLKDKQKSVAASLTPRRVGSPRFNRRMATPTRGGNARTKLSFKTPGPVQSSRLRDRRKRNPLTSLKNTQSHHRVGGGGKQDVAATPGAVRRAAALSLPATPLVGDAVQRHRILQQESSSKKSILTATLKKSKKKSSKKRSAADVYHARGFAFRKKGDFKSAIVEYTKAIEANPKHFKAFFNRAFAFDKLRRFRDAVQDYTTALRIDPSNPYAMFNRGIVYDRSGDFAKAIEDFTKAIETLPSNADFLHNRAYSLRKLGRFRDAIEDYTACLRIDPKHLKALFNRGSTYDKIGQWERAIEDFTSALALDSRNANVFHNRGTSCVLLLHPSQILINKILISHART